MNSSQGNVQRYFNNRKQSQIQLDPYYGLFIIKATLCPYYSILDIPIAILTAMLSLCILMIVINVVCYDPSYSFIISLEALISADSKSPK